MELDTHQVMKIFNVTMMTTSNWRHPHKSSQKTKLPFHTEKVGSERHRVYFVWSEVKQWAKENKVKVVCLPKDLT